MAIVELNLPHHRYEIRIEPRALATLGASVRQVAPHARCALLYDARLPETHVQQARASLAEAGYAVTAEGVPLGEDRKTLDTVRRLYDVLLEAKLERRSPVIALGGGVAGDTVGFAAATYLRGVPFIQCPTTLLAMVDASVGGKVGVNVPQGKNLIGAFHQPALVVIDTDTLRTLPDRELRCGLAECVKHGVIRDPDLFAWIGERLDAIQNLESDTLVELVGRNVRIKADVVMADEKETGERAHLNFGHTFAHAIEATSGYGRYEHGEAVALGMIAAARLAGALGRCERSLAAELAGLLDRIGLPVRAPDLAPTDQLMAAMQMDKKVAGGKVRLVLPVRMGEVMVTDQAPAQAIAAAWESLRGQQTH